MASFSIVHFAACSLSGLLAAGASAPAELAGGVALEAPAPGTPLVVAQASPAPAASAPSAPAPKAPGPSGDAATSGAPSHVSPAAAPVVERVQRFYERTSDFTASFEQTYAYKALRRKVVSRGRVSFKRPGKMRWDYATPREKRFIVDGRDLWVYTPEDRVAMRQRDFAMDALSASITFLWGKGRLADEFSIELRGKDLLVLTPLKAQAAFKRVRLQVDVETGQVLRSWVEDGQGNVNRMVFTDVKLNPGVPDSDFAFTPPAGVSVQDLGALGGAAP